MPAIVFRKGSKVLVIQFAFRSIQVGVAGRENTQGDTENRVEELSPGTAKASPSQDPNSV